MSFRDYEDQLIQSYIRPEAKAIFDAYGLMHANVTAELLQLTGNKLKDVLEAGGVWKPGAYTKTYWAQLLQYFQPSVILCWSTSSSCW